MFSSGCTIQFIANSFPNFFLQQSKFRNDFHCYFFRIGSMEVRIRRPTMPSLLHFFQWGVHIMWLWHAICLPKPILILFRALILWGKETETAISILQKKTLVLTHAVRTLCYKSNYYNWVFPIKFLSICRISRIFYI